MRKYIYPTVLFLGCALLLMGCGNGQQEKKETAGAENTIEINAEDADLIDCEEMINIKALIPLRMNEDDFLGTIDKVLFTDEAIVVLDKETASISVFDKKGNLVSKVSKKGRGPNEYLSIKNISVTAPNTLEIVDNAARSIKKYSFDGELLDKKSINAWPSAYMKNDNYEYYVLYSAYGANAEDLNYLNILSEDGDNTGYFPFKETVLSEHKNPTYLFSNGKDVYYHQYFEDNIYRLEGNKLFWDFKIDFGKNAYPSKDLLSAKTLDDYDNVLNSGKYIGNIFNVYVTTNYLHFMYTKNDGGVNTYVYNLENHKSHHYTAMKSCDTGIPISAMASDGDDFYSIVNPLEFSKASLAKMNLKYDLDLTNKSNYVLVKYNYK